MKEFDMNWTLPIHRTKSGASQNIFGMEFLPREGLYFLFDIPHPKAPFDGAQNKRMSGTCKKIKSKGEGLLSLNA